MGRDKYLRKPKDYGFNRDFYKRSLKSRVREKTKDPYRKLRKLRKGAPSPRNWKAPSGGGINKRPKVQRRGRTTTRSRTRGRVRRR